MMKKNQTKSIFLLLGILILFQNPSDISAQSNRGGFSIGITGGISRVEGDMSEPSLNTAYSLGLYQKLNSHLEIYGKTGYSLFTGDPLISNNTAMEIRNLNSKVFPFETGFRFTLSEKLRHRLFTSAGIGLIRFDWTADAGTQLNLLEYNPLAIRSSGSDVVMSFDWGIERYSGNSIGLEFKIGYSYYLTDDIDAINYHGNPEGDRNDGRISLSFGLKFYPNSKKDSDSDMILDKWDGAPLLKEDIDGYLDNDGIPDKDNDADGIPDSVDTEPNFSANRENVKPVVIHDMIMRADKNVDLLVTCAVMNEDNIRRVAVIYRKTNEKEWNAKNMKKVKDDKYAAIIPGSIINSPGIEYFIVAVDRPLTGIGTFGTMNNPVKVGVEKSSKNWRIPGYITGIATAVVSSYFILDKQVSN